MGQMSWQDMLRLPSGRLHVFVAFWIVSLPTKTALLVEMTGLTLKTVQAHLVALCEQGLVVRERGLLSLSLEALALGYPFVFSPAPNDVVVNHSIDNNNMNIYGGEIGKNFPQIGGFEGVDRKSLLIENDGNKQILPMVEDVDAKSLPISDEDDRKNLPIGEEDDRKSLPIGEEENGKSLPTTVVGNAQQVRENALRAILKKYGIDWNWKTAQLAGCSWVTEKYVAAHVGARRNNLGLAITLMLRGVPAPKQEVTATFWGETADDELIFDS